MITSNADSNTWPGADQITEAQHCCLDIMAMTCGDYHWTDQMKRAVIYRLNMAIDLAAKRQVATQIEKIKHSADYHDAQAHLVESSYTRGIADGLYDALAILDPTFPQSGKDKPVTS